jgi:DNA polymerase-1
MTISPNTDIGYRLLHEGVIALSQVEANGMRVNVQRLNDTIERTSHRITKLKTKIRCHRIGRMWQKKFGVKTNFGSREQLSAILFGKRKHGCLGYKAKEFTDSGRAKMDASSLEHIKLPFVKGYLRLETLQKMRSTYLNGIRRELDSSGFIHPVFNLHTTQTYRSSSDTPNFQNMPVRDVEMGKMIRQNFIARDGCVIVENDFKGIEVSVSACYHKDQRFIEYIKNPAMDMHRDMAMQIYILNKEEWGILEKRGWSKAIRHAAKNQFVFPQFYGDWYMSCARYLWEEIGKRDFKGPDGNSLYEHLAANGITELGDIEQDEDGNYPDPVKGTFVYHIKEVENDFWNNRFRQYGKWKKKWHKAYLENGYFDTYTGFRIGGVMGRNAVINYPVQGAAFHCLLWSLIRIQKILRKRKMKTKIVGQIHDSIVADVPVGELDDYLAIVQRVTRKDILKAYPWIIVPLVIECEIAPLNGSWFDKEEVKITGDGLYQNKDASYKGNAAGLIKFWDNKNKAA